MHSMATHLPAHTLTGVVARHYTVRMVKIARAFTASWEDVHAAEERCGGGGGGGGGEGGRGG
jgi:hypothetical protein